MLSSVTEALDSDDCWAVFVVGDPGLGASSLLAHLHQSRANRSAIMTVHGSPSLAAVLRGAFPLPL
ncbi:hypothetical protein AHiyo6_09350 [Arthrobacter sp. Hiyo6]|nr:hypothetical protein AHiyo6_09350 [Arthrobacter sp. Hiyo6]